MIEHDFNLPVSCETVLCPVCPCFGSCSLFVIVGVDFEETNWFSIFDCTTTEESSS